MNAARAGHEPRLMRKKLAVRWERSGYSHELLADGPTTATFAPAGSFSGSTWRGLVRSTSDSLAIYTCGAGWGVAGCGGNRVGGVMCSRGQCG